MKKILFAAMLLPFFLVACKKKSKNDSSNFTKLTANTWKITAVNISQNGAVAFDYYSQMQDCAKDNFYTFNSDYTITSNEGPTKCDTSIKEVTTDGNWTLTNNETIFTLKSSSILPISGDQSMTIVSLDDNTLKLAKDTSVNYPGIGLLTGTVNVTFSKY